ncbi:queuine tRNA-ribosyltransferase family protein [Candidatus Nomurabacteria bacterium]|uniref:Queuine tRNA-ribosyltransferase family protein n=1 Tax=candidate division WWE3 bacterium TaxID=2053526 RepID=A0A955E1H0_UNCKA|nr:queuine tRNA-ribosyltransferase family protein [candidate division WWE3 bacterium]MCB9823937.1 queuine tRNA-ribosyltransferase family protein [Candidatus Nomurabacteria bacterium]MCB9827082.1 queuine tRNA-ribosyltransferase family protein [Candidatus Nomurabacteria bacterium]MCB9827876.1 queuine tRNA-ribosyltransferase family protein [Candidatus Nomurabacteria bacterium]HXK52888.1 tRNA guanosine(34) transglycosylase Tgt [bacterium]
MKELEIKRKSYKTPIYLPDATLGVVRGLDSKDLLGAGVKGVVVNTYHLHHRPGLEHLSEAGGIKAFMGFDGLVASDSGGWQIFSLIHRHGLPGKISDEGVKFADKDGGKKMKLFTPEDSIKMQFELKSDIVVCLDDFTPPDADRVTIEKSVNRTVLWAQRSKIEYERQLNIRGIERANAPVLMAVVQGGYDKSLRLQCCNDLSSIGFDMYGFGGYVVNEDGLDLEISEYLASIIPSGAYKFALGVGTPWQIAMCYKFGWDIFDCTLPTRDARHGRLYVYTGDYSNPSDLLTKGLHSHISITSGKYFKDHFPISDSCDCLTCSNYTRSYLHHLFKVKDVSAYRLATIHNLRTYTRLIEALVASDIR